MQNYLSSTNRIAPPTSPALPVALRVHIVEAGGVPADDCIIVREPRMVHLAFQNLDVEDALAHSDGQPNYGAGALTTFVYLPSGAQSPFELQKRAEQWMASRPDERGAPYEVPHRSDRILWRRGRALCFGTGEFFHDVRNAVAYFSFCEAELARLEDRVAAQWPIVEGDLPLTHSVTRREVQRQQAVDSRTHEAHAMRIVFIRLDTALERLDRVLSAPSQRIVSELAQQADTIDRLRLLDDGIELAQEVYDTANDRLLEYRYFHAEYRIEIIIAVILFAELIAVCVELWRNW